MLFPNRMSYSVLGRRREPALYPVANVGWMVKQRELTLPPRGYPFIEVESVL